MTDLINRSAVIVTPTKKYIQWVRGLDWEEPFGVSDKQIKEAANVYLVEEAMTGTKEEVRHIMEQNYLEIAMEEFSAWWQVDEDWPLLKSLEDFEKFFHWKLNEMVLNLCDETMDFDPLD